MIHRSTSASCRSTGPNAAIQGSDGRHRHHSGTRPGRRSTILLRGKIEEATGNKEKAESSYQKVTELNPFNEQAFLYLGQLYITQNKLAEAIELFTEATELNPNFAEAYHERGRAKLLNGDKEGSAEDMKKGLELNPKEIQNFNGQYGNQPGGSTGNILGL